MGRNRDLYFMSLTAAHNIFDLRRMAKRRLPRMVFDYIDGGSDDERTLRANHDRFADYSLLHRVLVDVSEIETLRARLATTYGVKVLYHPANMLKPDEIEDLIAYAHKELGRLDILINNAGIQYVSPVDDFPTEKWAQGCCRPCAKGIERALQIQSSHRSHLIGNVKKGGVPVNLRI